MSFCLLGEWTLFPKSPLTVPLHTRKQVINLGESLQQCSWTFRTGNKLPIFGPVYPRISGTSIFLVCFLSLFLLSDIIINSSLKLIMLVMFLEWNMLGILQRLTSKGCSPPMSLVSLP